MNGLRRVHTRVAVVLVLVSLSLLAQGPFLAFADRPNSDTLHLNDTNTVTTLCGFPLTAHEEGPLRTTLFYDRNGQVDRVTVNWEGVESTLTNPANGISLSYRLAGHDGFAIDREGGFTAFTEGVRGIITVPGSGVVSAEAGNIRIHVAPDGSMNLRRSGLFVEGDFSAVCNYLQGTP